MVTGNAAASVPYKGFGIFSQLQGVEGDVFMSWSKVCFEEDIPLQPWVLPPSNGDSGWPPALQLSAIRVQRWLPVFRNIVGIHVSGKGSDVADFARAIHLQICCQYVRIEGQLLGRLLPL